MTHLAAGPGFGLALEVDRGVWPGGKPFPGIYFIADQIGHYGVGMAMRIAERPAADSTQHRK